MTFFLICFIGGIAGASLGNGHMGVYFLLTVPCIWAMTKRDDRRYKAEVMIFTLVTMTGAIIGAKF